MSVICVRLVRCRLGVRLVIVGRLGVLVLGVWRVLCLMGLLLVLGMMLAARARRARPALYLTAARLAIAGDLAALARGVWPVLCRLGVRPAIGGLKGVTARNANLAQYR